MKKPRKNPAAVALGRKGGSANTPAQQAARAANAKLGGRPNRARQCIINYLFRNLQQAKEQAETIDQRDLFDAAILAGKTHYAALAISNFLKRPSEQSWQAVQKAESEAQS